MRLFHRTASYRRSVPSKDMRACRCRCMKVTATAWEKGDLPCGELPRGRSGLCQPVHVCTPPCRENIWAPFTRPQAADVERQNPGRSLEACRRLGLAGNAGDVLPGR